MVLTYTLQELPKVAKELITNVPTKTLLFNAEMGVGKTTLIKEICKQLGVEDTISSPTYSLVNEYQGNGSLIYHFDFYRILHEEEAYDIGFEEYLDEKNWIFIEWPKKVHRLLPENCVKINIKLQNDGKRILLME